MAHWFHVKASYTFNLTVTVACRLHDSVPDHSVWPLQWPVGSPRYCVARSPWITYVRRRGPWSTTPRSRPRCWRTGSAWTSTASSNRRFTPWGDTGRRSPTPSWTVRSIYSVLLSPYKYSLYVSKSIKTFTQKNYLQMDSLCLQPTCLFCFCFVKKPCNDFVFIVCGEFEQLLEDQAPLQSYVEWMDNMVDRCVVQVN